MRITDLSKAPIATVPTAKSPQDDSDHGASAAATGQDAVKVSEEARALSQRAEAELDAARIERLKALVETGALPFDPVAIAQRIVAGG